MSSTRRMGHVGGPAAPACVGALVLALMASVAAVGPVPAAAESSSSGEVTSPAEEPTVAQSGDPEPVAFDDPLLDLQWYLDRTRTRQAWALTPGLSSVTIAIVDTGVDAAHLDLAGAFWADPDNGANGFDYVRSSTSTYVDAEQDWHGTAVAGVAASRADDGYGMAGVAPGVSLLVARIYASTSTSDAPAIEAGYASAAQAIREVAAAGADVILLTWGGTAPDDDLFDAISDVEVPVVAAAGNDGRDLSTTSQKRYPAAYQLPNLVTVAASDRHGELLGGDRPSNFGVGAVDLAAPGVDIVSLMADGSHKAFEGTSFAAPQVAGALALGRSMAPAATTGELIGELLRTVDRRPGLTDKVASGGELNVLAFLQSLERPVCTPGLPPVLFDDVSRGSVHVANIDCVVFHRVSLGVTASTFQPARRITRAEMASFLARSLHAAGHEPPDEIDRIFPDIEGSVHADAIDQIADAGITIGRPDGTYGPNERVPRGQMATFLVRTLELMTEQELRVDRQWFDDIDGHTHERTIRIARDVGITVGGSQAGSFEPDRNVARAQMASFVARMLDAAGRQGVTIRQIPR